MYELHRVFCALPAQMREERLAFPQAVGDFNTAEAGGRGILFVPVAASSAMRAACPDEVRANICACRHYVQVLPAGAPPPESDPRLDYPFALACCADASLPMQEAVALPQENFSDIPEFKQRIRALLARWLAVFPAQSA
jgi:hypothetical protein